MNDDEICLGDKVKDEVSGFEGVVTAIHSYLHGCQRMTLLSASKEGSAPVEHTFDEPQLSVIQKNVFIPGYRLTGGPEKYTDPGKSLGNK